MLEPVVLTAILPDTVEILSAPDWLTTLFDPNAETPVKPDGELKTTVRAMLRHGKFQPSGRNKPSSEYLVRAAEEGRLQSINLPVDIGNVVSLHSGLPVSVIDLDTVKPPLRIGLAPVGSGYIFNPSGQELDTGDLLCLHDSAGPCGSPIKDSQRSKTHVGTRRVLIIIWGAKGLEQHIGRVKCWCCDILQKAGAQYEVLI